MNPSELVRDKVYQLDGEYFQFYRLSRNIPLFQRLDNNLIPVFIWSRRQQKQVEEIVIIYQRLPELTESNKTPNDQLELF